MPTTLAKLKGMIEAFDFTKEWEKISKEHSKKKDRIQAFKELWRARSELALAELTSGIMREEKDKTDNR